MGLLSGVLRMGKGGGRGPSGALVAEDMLSPTTPPDIRARIGAFQSNDFRNFGRQGGLPNATPPQNPQVQELMFRKQNLEMLRERVAPRAQAAPAYSEEAQMLRSVEEQLRQIDQELAAMGGA